MIVRLEVSSRWICRQWCDWLWPVRTIQATSARCICGMPAASHWLRSIVSTTRRLQAARRLSTIPSASNLHLRRHILSSPEPAPDAAVPPTLMARRTMFARTSYPSVWYVRVTYYVVAVVLVYGFSIVLLIASHIKRKNAKALEDRQINKYLQEFQVYLQLQLL